MWSNATAGFGDTPAEEAPQNAVEWESILSEGAWSVLESDSSDGGGQWEVCRYYEVGSVVDGIRDFVSGSLRGEQNGLIWQE